jgi:hypothetical protein
MTEAWMQPLSMLERGRLIFGASERAGQGRQYVTAAQESCTDSDSDSDSDCETTEDAISDHVVFKAKFLRWQRRHSWRRLCGVRRVWCTSDLHVEGKPNLVLLDALSGYEDDALIVAGDMATGLELLRMTLELLVGKFRHVFYCVGNHELWHRKFEQLEDGSVNAGPDSLTRLLAILKIATRAGAHCSSALVGADLCLMPLQSWYHYGFLSGMPAGIDAPDDFRLREMDNACAWPPALARRSTSGALASYFASLNDDLIAELAAVRASSTAGGGPRALVTFSHFVPTRELHRGYGYLGDVEGSVPLGEQVRRLTPAVHVFGHTHWTIDATLGPTRYVQYPLGYAHEREKAAYRVHASEREPFALVWEREHGASVQVDPWASVVHAGDVMRRMVMGPVMGCAPQCVLPRNISKSREVRQISRSASAPPPPPGPEML